MGGFSIYYCKWETWTWNKEWFCETVHFSIKLSKIGAIQVRSKDGWFVEILSPNKDIFNLFSLEFDSKFLLQLSKSESFLAGFQVSGKNSDTQDGIFSSAETTKLVIELHFSPIERWSFMGILTPNTIQNSFHWPQITSSYVKQTSFLYNKYS